MGLEPQVKVPRRQGSGGTAAHIPGNPATARLIWNIESQPDCNDVFLQK